MTTAPSRFATDLANLSRRLKAIERGGQLAHSTVTVGDAPMTIPAIGETAVVAESVSTEAKARAEEAFQAAATAAIELAEATAEISTIVADMEQVRADLEAASALIDSTGETLASRLATAEGDLAAATGRLATAESELEDAFGRLDAVPGEIDAAKAAALTAAAADAKSKADAAQAAAISAAATTAQTKADAAKTAAISAAATDAQTKADAAKTAAITAASLDAQSKADAAKAAALAEAATTAQAKANAARDAAIEAAEEVAELKASGAQTAAIEAAQADAKAKADAAQAAAISAASSDAASKAAAAQAAAISAAATDAKTKADAAQAAAITAAAADAKTKADAAKAAAIAAAATDATTKADAAKAAAISVAQTAQSAAEAAATAASTAQTTASDAATAAASAAGVAAAKADVLIQSTAPAAEMRKASTLWIDTTGGANTPKRWTTGTTWVAVTDKAATDAASAAAAAQTAAGNAATAASTAQSKADAAHSLAGSAESNATAAVTAAGLAQTTADTAQTTASTAVADAAAAQASAISAARNGGQKVANGSFERGMEGWAAHASLSIADGAGRDGGRALTTTGNGSTNQDGFAVKPGQRWRFSMFYKTEAATGAGLNGGLRLQRSGDGINYSDAASANCATVGDWTEQVVEYVIPATGVTMLRPRLAWAYTGGVRMWIDDVSLVDVTEVVAAKAAADAAATTAGTAKSTADTAKSTADTAKSTADGAATTAGTAASTASTAKSTADTAKSTADAAASTASSAASTAATAKDTADTAKSTADTAKSTADAAATAASTAQTTADNRPKLLFGTGTPAGTAPQGSTWFRVNASNQVIGQWQQTAAGIASTWTSRPVHSDVIANLDVGKLSVGTATIVSAVAQKIAAATGSFQTVDVANLFVSASATIPEAVISKLFADVVVAKTAVATEAFVGPSALIEGAVVAGKIQGQAIDGMTITGAKVQSTAAENRGVKLTSAGIQGYDSSGNVSFFLDATTGEINALKGKFAGTVDAAGIRGTDGLGSTAIVRPGAVELETVGTARRVRMIAGNLSVEDEVTTAGAAGRQRASLGLGYLTFPNGSGQVSAGSDYLHLSGRRLVGTGATAGIKVGEQASEYGRNAGTGTTTAVLTSNGYSIDVAETVARVGTFWGGEAATAEGDRHALQIGGKTGRNIAADGEKLLFRNNGAELGFVSATPPTLVVNAAGGVQGGNVNAGTAIILTNIWGTPSTMRGLSFVNGVLYVQYSGVYQVTFNAHWVTSAPARHQARVLRNGTLWDNQYTVLSSGITSTNSVQANGLVTLAAGDQLRFVTMQDAGAKPVEAAQHTAVSVIYMAGP